MRKLKVIFSVVLALVMLSTSFAFSTIASAADVKTAETGQEANLQSNIEDGVILHACCWSYAEIEKNIPAIAAAGYSAVQTSPVQQPKDYSLSNDVSGQWWKLYQPVSFSIADKSWLGTAAQLKSLCTTAHQHGVKIICDIVSNHLGASSSEKTPKKLADEVQTYEPTLWNAVGNGKTQNNQYFHQNFSAATDGTDVTTGTVTACPDLNTGNDYIQGRVKSLLRSCIDQGVDGFRFDAAKHIETPSDSTNASNYWTNVLGDANTYASSKGKTMFYYGEVLNTVGGGRSSTNYTNLNGGKYRITDNKASATIRGAVTGHNASAAANASFPVAGSAGKSVLWAESHDTYLGKDDSTLNVSDNDIAKTWALTASRKDATALFFARTNNKMRMGNAALNTTYKSLAVAEVNKFRNNYVGQSEKLGSSGNFAYVARGKTGIVIVNVNGTSAQASISGTGLDNGTYTDMVTGSKFTVSGGTLSGSIGSSGIAVVTTGDTTPFVSASKESQTFEGESITTQLQAANVTNATYQLDNYAPVSFTGSPTIRLGKDYNYGDTFTLTLTGTDGKQTVTEKYTYTKKKAASSGVYVIIPNSLITSKSGGKDWTTPMYCFIYDEVKTSSYPKYNNGQWPGETMEYDEKNDVYYLEVHSDSCYKQANASSTPTLDTTYDLAHSSKARVIISDSYNGSEGGNKCPSGSGTAAQGFLLNGTSHIYKQLYGTETAAWTTTTMIPGQEAPVDATEVTKGNATQPTQTQPTQTQPTQTEASSQTQPTSGEKRYYGDANLDGNVNINDVTTIQMHLVKAPEMTDSLALTLANVDGDSRVSIKDANFIQRKLAGMSNTGKVGEEYNQTQPTQATQQTQATQATQATQVTQAPATFTLYVKTTVAWISSSGAEPYVMDNNTGESYLMVKDESAYPEVFTAEVPETISSVTFYRATAPTAAHYNEVTGLTVSKTNNCINVYIAQDGLEAVLGATTGPYVPETAPSFSLTRVYALNDAHWSKVYLYGWSKGINQETLEMTNVPGTDYWYVDLPKPALDGDSFFKFKDTEGKDNWVNQTSQNVKIQDPYNCYNVSNGQGSVYNG